MKGLEPMFPYYQISNEATCLGGANLGSFAEQTQSKMRNLIADKLKK